VAVERWLAGALTVSVLMGTTLACTSTTERTEAGGDPSAAIDVGFADAYPLPFGLEHVEGTTSIGRRAVYEDATVIYGGQPGSLRILRAAYRVDGKDPLGVFRDWVDQLDRVGLGEVTVRAGQGARSPWLQAQGLGSTKDISGLGNTADLELWTADDTPVLFVRLALSAPDAVAGAVEDDAGTPDPPEPVVDEAVRSGGDVLFTEGDDVVHLPARTRSLTATFPTVRGMEGTTSVIAAEDGAATVRDLLDEALVLHSGGEVSAPVTTEIDGATVIEASFFIGGGGWSLTVVAVQGPDDPAATLYVDSGPG